MVGKLMYSSASKQARTGPLSLAEPAPRDITVRKDRIIARSKKAERALKEYFDTTVGHWRDFLQLSDASEAYADYLLQCDKIAKLSGAAKVLAVDLFELYTVGLLSKLWVTGEGFTWDGRALESLQDGGVSYFGRLHVQQDRIVGLIDWSRQLNLLPDPFNLYNQLYVSLDYRIEETEREIGVREDDIREITSGPEGDGIGSQMMRDGLSWLRVKLALWNAYTRLIRTYHNHRISYEEMRGRVRFLVVNLQINEDRRQVGLFTLFTDVIFAKLRRKVDEMKTKRESEEAYWEDMAGDQVLVSQIIQRDEALASVTRGFCASFRKQLLQFYHMDDATVAYDLYLRRFEFLKNNYEPPVTEELSRETILQRSTVKSFFTVELIELFTLGFLSKIAVFRHGITWNHYTQVTPLERGFSDGGVAEEWRETRPSIDVRTETLMQTSGSNSSSRAYDRLIASWQQVIDVANEEYETTIYLSDIEATQRQVYIIYRQVLLNLVETYRRFGIDFSEVYQRFRTLCDARNGASFEECFRAKLSEFERRGYEKITEYINDSLVWKQVERASEKVHSRYMNHEDVWNAIWERLGNAEEYYNRPDDILRD
jgi:hypothetical protein